MAERIPARLTAAQGRRFGLTVGIAFLALAGVLLWRDKQVGSLIAGSAGTLLILAGLLVPTHLGPVERAWMKLAHLISKVTTPIFLGLLYLLVFTTIGFVMRLFGKRPLEREPATVGFWIERVHTARRSNLQRQF